MPFTEGQIYQTTSGGAPEPNFYAYKNGQLQYIKDLGDQYTQQRGDQSGFDFAPTFRNQLSQQFGTPIQTIEANEVGDYASGLRAQGRIAFQNPISSSDLKSLLATPFSQTQAPINPESRLSGQTNLPPQQFQGGVYQGQFPAGAPPQGSRTTQTPVESFPKPGTSFPKPGTSFPKPGTNQPDVVPIPNASNDPNAYPIVPIPNASNDPNAYSVIPIAAPGGPLADKVAPGTGGGQGASPSPIFVKNNATGQFAQVDQFGHLKGFGTPQEFAAAGGDYNKVIGLDSGSFDRVSKGQAYLDPSTGKLNDPGMQKPLGTDASGIETGGVANPANGPKDFIATYKDIITSLGLPDIKSEFEKVQKELKDLNLEKSGKILDIQNDPWMMQGVKNGNIERINKSYETKEAILTNKGTIYDTLYKEGIQQAQFLATGEYKQQEDAAALAEKKAEAEAKLRQEKFQPIHWTDPFTGQTSFGIFDVKTGKFSGNVISGGRQYNPGSSPGGIVTTGITASPGEVNNDALQGLPQGFQDVVKNITNYKIPLPSGFALKSPYWQKVLEVASQYDPTFDATQYQVRLHTKQDFTSGKSAQNIRSLNTAIGHLETLNNKAVALQNGPIQLWNRIANTGLTQFGDKRVTEFNNAATAVESELANVFKGMGASDQEIHAWRNNLSAIQSPQQLKGAINTAIELMGSRMQALQFQYETALGKPKDFRFLSDRSRRILHGLGADVNSLDPVPSQKGSGFVSPAEAATTNLQGSTRSGLKFQILP